MSNKPSFSEIGPSEEKLFPIQTILKVSAVFHVFLIGLALIFYFWEDEPTYIPVPPIMELVSAPAPKVKTVKPKVTKPKPEPKVEEPTPEPEPKIEEPQPKVEEPKPEPKPKPKPQSEPKVEEVQDSEPVEEEWDTDFETEAPAEEVQKVVAPKVDSRLRMFENTVRSKIMRNFAPPKGLGLPYGTEFLIEITCLRAGGRAINVKVHTSSGSFSLDKYGLRAINLAILPKIPPHYPEDEVKLHVKFVYNE